MINKCVLCFMFVFLLKGCSSDIHITGHVSESTEGIIITTDAPSTPTPSTTDTSDERWVPIENMSLIGLEGDSVSYYVFEDTCYISRDLQDKFKKRKLYNPIDISNPYLVWVDDSGKRYYNDKYNALLDWICDDLFRDSEVISRSVGFKGDSVCFEIETASFVYGDGYPNADGTWSGWILDLKSGEVIDEDWHWNPFNMGNFYEMNDLRTLTRGDEAIYDPLYNRLKGAIAEAITEQVGESVNEAELRILNQHVVFDFYTDTFTCYGVCLNGESWEGSIWNDEVTGIFSWNPEYSDILWLTGT